MHWYPTLQKWLKWYTSFNLLFVYVIMRTGNIFHLCSGGWNFPTPDIWLGMKIQNASLLSLQLNFDYLKLNKIVYRSFAFWYLIVMQIHLIIQSHCPLWHSDNQSSKYQLGFKKVPRGIQCKKENLLSLRSLDFVLANM